MKISGVLLAAGCSKRMGAANKLFLEYKNHTILDEILIQLMNSKLTEIFVVTGFESERVVEAVDSFNSKKIKCLYNKKYKEGRGSSIKYAVNQIKETSDAILFMVADKPMVKTSLVNKTIDAFVENDPKILYVETDSGRGHPIVFSQELFPELLDIDGDVIGNELVAKYKAHSLVIKDTATQQDIDTYEDYLDLVQKEK